MNFSTSCVLGMITVHWRMKWDLGDTVQPGVRLDWNLALLLTCWMIRGWVMSPLCISILWFVNMSVILPPKDNRPMRQTSCYDLAEGAFLCPFMFMPLNFFMFLPFSVPVFSGLTHRTTPLVGKQPPDQHTASEVIHRFCSSYFRDSFHPGAAFYGSVCWGHDWATNTHSHAEAKLGLSKTLPLHLQTSSS